MRYAVVYVEPPKPGSPADQMHNWRVVQEGHERMPLPKPIAEADPEWNIGGGVWVIPLGKGIPLMLALADWCRHLKTKYRAFIVDGKPDMTVIGPETWSARLRAGRGELGRGLVESIPHARQGRIGELRPLGLDQLGGDPGRHRRQHHRPRGGPVVRRLAARHRPPSGLVVRAVYHVSPPSRSAAPAASAARR